MTVLLILYLTGLGVLGVLGLGAFLLLLCGLAWLFGL
jgi:hypothetical protein